uniref:Uncharacterized protein n=1 Tax=Tanacetum cinerariifolium TaxID=118510 RepID=A0A6L2NYE4_TANCI|nr:hypothetical protein [Tanacetum cinerariifolium]
MSFLNQQTLVKSGATDRPLILEKGYYIPWESQFKRFMVNKRKYGKRMWYSIIEGPYVRPMIIDPDDPDSRIPEPMSKMTEANKIRYTADVRVMNYILQAIPNDIYNSEDSCKDAHKIRNQAVIHDGRVDIQTKNYGYDGNGNRNAERRNMNQVANVGNADENAETKPKYDAEVDTEVARPDTMSDELVIAKMAKVHIMSVPASPEHVPAIPDQLPVEPPLAPNPPKLDNDYLDVINYDEEEMSHPASLRLLLVIKNGMVCANFGDLGFVWGGKGSKGLIFPQSKRSSASEIEGVKFLGLEGAVLRGEVCVLSNLKSVGGGGGGGSGSSSIFRVLCSTNELACPRFAAGCLADGDFGYVCYVCSNGCDEWLNY